MLKREARSAFVEGLFRKQRMASRRGIRPPILPHQGGTTGIRQCTKGESAGSRASFRVQRRLEHTRLDRKDA